jgi:hypothetical protein
MTGKSADRVPGLALSEDRWEQARQRFEAEAAAALEYIWAGDAALAAMEYSSLPSWLSFLVDSRRTRARGEETA